jgi:hypothetical protein
MLSPEEVLLFQAVKDEEERLAALQAAGIIGAVGGASVGATAGSVPHSIGNAINAGKDALAARQGLAPSRPPMSRLRPGFRAAGGLVGMILGGGLGAGTAALLRQGSEAGEMLGKIQAQRGQLSEMDQRKYAQLLGEIYNNPSNFM